MALPLLKVSFVMNVIAVIWVLCAIVLALVILIQKGKGGGLSAAFGGGMGGGILGSKTGDFLTWFTIVLVGAFLFLSIVLAKFYKPTNSRHDAPAGPARQVQPIEQAEEGENEPVGNVDMPTE
jgi:preprotein translocase subunit SecG